MSLGVPGAPDMKSSLCLGAPSGLVLLLVCCPLLLLAQSANKAGDNGHADPGNGDPGRCMRHHFVETITHPIYKCNFKVRMEHTGREGGMEPASILYQVATHKLHFVIKKC